MAESTATAAPVLTGRFQQAVAVACEVHAAQLRKGTRIPYLAHLLSVAALVLEHGGGEDLAIGGLLHDAVEDSADGTQMERRIREEFGDRVAGIVMAVRTRSLFPGSPSRHGGTARRPTSTAWPVRTTWTCCRLRFPP
jgi:(p)ppGpp synthase/HD superfamily hydrolase